MTEKSLKKNNDRANTKGILKTVGVYAALAIVVIVVFNYVFMLIRIPTENREMENTLAAGDIVISTRYDKTDIDRYDIMIFVSPDGDPDYLIRRVIGLPGETVVVDEGKVYADGVELDQSFIPERQTTMGDGTYEVPEGCYFMLGDDRNHSLDSRFWENTYVPAENMVAKARIIFFPFTRFGSIGYGK